MTYYLSHKVLEHYTNLDSSSLERSLFCLSGESFRGEIIVLSLSLSQVTNHIFDKKHCYSAKSARCKQWLFTGCALLKRKFDAQAKYA